MTDTLEHNSMTNMAMKFKTVLLCIALAMIPAACSEPPAPALVTYSDAALQESAKKLMQTLPEEKRREFALALLTSSEMYIACILQAKQKLQGINPEFLDKGDIVLTRINLHDLKAEGYTADEIMDSWVALTFPQEIPGNLSPIDKLRVKRENAEAVYFLKYLGPLLNGKTVDVILAMANDFQRTGKVIISKADWVILLGVR
jgi:hypothetical protein